MPLAFAAGVELNLVFGRRQFVCAVPQLWSLETGTGAFIFVAWPLLFFRPSLRLAFNRLFRS
jgi:hypothetical protein